MTSAPADTSLIPSTSFETTVFQAREQFDAWREYISFVFKVSPVEMPRDDGFLAVAQGFHLGDLVLARTRFEAQRFVRTAQHARVDLLDHYLVQLYTEGGYTGEVDGKPIEVRPGMLSILDLARTTKTRATAAECISFVVPRDTIEPLLPRGADLHGLVLDSGYSRLFNNYLLALVRQLPTTQRSQAPHIARATCDLLAACLMAVFEQGMDAHHARFGRFSSAIQSAIVLSRDRLPKSEPSQDGPLDIWVRTLRARGRSSKYCPHDG
ncbi:MAG: hypothetical protein C0P74_000920 [Gammaproteobacteria bacterium]|nr:hypothetical protein [Gammaproteobacteria bacterium]